MVERLHESVILLDEVVRSLFLNHGTLTVAAQVSQNYRVLAGQLDCHCCLHGDADGKSSVRGGLARKLHLIDTAPPVT